MAGIILFVWIGLFVSINHCSVLVVFPFYVNSASAVAVNAAVEELAPGPRL
jgi:hypothetical protein